MQHSKLNHRHFLSGKYWTFNYFHWHAQENLAVSNEDHLFNLKSTFDYFILEASHENCESIFLWNFCYQRFSCCLINRQRWIAEETTTKHIYIVQIYAKVSFSKTCDFMAHTFYCWFICERLNKVLKTTNDGFAIKSYNFIRTTPFPLMQWNIEYYLLSYSVFHVFCKC